MANNKIDFMEMAISKLCHDMAGPIGAVSNGVEFLTESDSAFRQQALDLLELSSRQLIARLKYFRYQYGSIRDEAQDKYFIP